MHKRSYRASNARAGKSTKVSKRSFSDDARRHLADQASAQAGPSSAMPSPSSLGEGSPKLNEEIVSLVVGRDERLFAAHELILSRSPWFAFKLTKGHEAQDQFSPSQKTISLPDDDPQVISAVLEFMYRGDYTPHLVHDRRTSRLSLDDSVAMAGNGPTMAQDSTETITPLNNITNRVARPADFATIFHSGVGDLILRDTAVYCAAHRFYMPDLERLALRKQGLQVGVDVATILRSAKFAYANTSGGESKLRAHYLTLIIRNRRTFMRSGTMQREMEKGGTMLFFDLFVAICNHIDDVVARNGGGEGGCGPGHSRGSVVASAAASTFTVNVGGCVHMASTSTLEVGCSPGRLINAARNKRPDYTGGSRF